MAPLPKMGEPLIFEDGGIELNSVGRYMLGRDAKIRVTLGSGGVAYADGVLRIRTGPCS